MNLKERKADFMNLCNEAKFAPSDKLIDWLFNGGYMTAPASTKHHGAYAGGLYDHHRAVYLRLKDMTEKNNLKWQRGISPFTVAMFHDLCKCDQYKAKGDIKELMVDCDGMGNDIAIEYEYNNKTLLKGHGSKSVIILSQFMTLTEEEIMCIRYHMGAYETDEWDEFDRAIKKYPNVLWTHHADMLASKVDGI